MMNSLYDTAHSTLGSMNPPIIIGEKEFELIKVSYPEHMDEIGTLRISSWKNERGINTDFFSQEKWVDDLDKDAHHWVILHQGHIVASARMSFHYTYNSIPYTNPVYESLFDFYGGLPIASINRLVVDPGSRGHGLARLLDETRVDFAIENGAKMITAQPLEGRVAALKKLDFIMIEQIVSPFQIPGREIFYMIKELSENKYVAK